MHPRHNTWTALGEIVERASNEWSHYIAFGAAAVDISRSNDEWLRLSIRLNDEDPRDRRSWAIDPDPVAHRTWRSPGSDVDVGMTSFSGTRREASVGVGAESNPSGGRGLVPVSGAATVLQSPATPSVSVARCVDGFRLSMDLESDEIAYGLGEKMGGLDRRGRTWAMWNTDEPLHLPDRDPLYQSIPVLYLFTPQRTRIVFVDSPATVYFDVGEGSRNELVVEVFDRQLDVYYQEVESLAAAVRRYAGLTGRVPLPPIWALGYHQSRYSYYPAARAVDVVETFREHAIPIDVLHLDIHYMHGFRVFTWDRERFPDPAATVRRLRELGVRVVTIIDPGVKVDPDYATYRRGLEQDVYLKAPDGSVYIGRVWPGDSAFPDFSDRRAREWWADEHPALFNVGVAGVWNDMNEPADFTGEDEPRPLFSVPDTLSARSDGNPKSMARAHNTYASGMNAATRLAFQRYRPEDRGFVLTRAGYAGIQRSAAVWTGDNHSWWEHLAASVPMFLTMGLSGVPFVGGDVGGFQGNADGELYARWIMTGALTPFFRGHSALDTVDHEPWSFGDWVTAIARRAIELRYRLLPYLYTLFARAAADGTPVMRPLVWSFPDDPRTHHAADAFMVGDAILVAPIRERFVTRRAVYLPAGRWIDLWSGAVHDAGDAGADVIAHAPLDRQPIFVRGGTVIPYEAARPTTDARGDGVLSLLVVPDGAGRASGDVYDDRGEGFGYRDGERFRASLRVDGATMSVTVDEGGWAPRWERLRVIVAGGERAADAADVRTHGVLDLPPTAEAPLAAGSVAL